MPPDIKSTGFKRHYSFFANHSHTAGGAIPDAWARSGLRDQGWETRRSGKGHHGNDQIILVRGKQIESVAPTCKSRRTRNYRSLQIDGASRPVRRAHASVHDAEERPRRKQLFHHHASGPHALSRDRRRGHARDMLASGFTTVRDVATTAIMQTRLCAKASNAAWCPAPPLLTPGASLRRTGDSFVCSRRSAIWPRPNTSSPIRTTK